MRLLISDYSGHPFQVQLSRELARRGHEVLHLFSASFQTPKGNLSWQPGDPENFDVRGVRTRKPFKKHSFVKRRQQEVEVGRMLAAEIIAFRPDAVISSNAPLDTQKKIQAAAHATNAKFVFWLQDIYSAAISKVVPQQVPVIGHLIADHYRRLEFGMLRKSDRIIAITKDFEPILVAAGVSAERISTVENWAPLDELPLQPRDNDWAQANFGDWPLRIVYSGTLGYKHNPDLLFRIAEALPHVGMFVFSEGAVADDLARRAATENRTNLQVRPWVPFADLPKMLSGADLFVAVIELDAGVYSVPSKILTYLTIGRPILASVPLENLAARLIERNDAGVVSPPDQVDALIGKASLLAADGDARTRMGDNGRAYAAQTFDVVRIADRFERVII